MFSQSDMENKNKYDNLLTVIIPFLNEGEEVEKQRV